MRRVFTLAALTVGALCISALPARAAKTATPDPRVLRDAGAAAPSLRAGAVTSVSIVPGTGRAEVVIAIAGDVNIQDFTLTGPARVVVDLSNARLGMAPSFYDRVARGGVTNVRMAQYKEDVVRIVIELDAMRTYEVTRGENDVRIGLTGGASSEFAAWHSGASTTTTPASPVVQTAARDVEAPAAHSPISGRAKRIVAPVQQSQQPRITVTYQDADIRDVLAAFAAFSGRTIVVGKDVSGTVSAEIRDQPWDVALQAILQAQGLDASEDANGIIAVDSYANILAKQASEPVTTQLISINYARASSLVNTIEGLLSKDCGPSVSAGGGARTPGQCVTRGAVSADSGTNTLVVTEVASRIDNLIGYVRDLDIRTPQVAIKAKILFVNRDDIEALGVKYDLGEQGTFFNRLIRRSDGSGGSFANDVTVIDVGGDALAAIANARTPVITPALELVYSTMIGKFSLTAFLDAAQTINLTDVQAEPSIVTLDNKQADILVGEETPIRIIDVGMGGGTAPRSTVQFKESGIRLTVTPHITNNRQVLMRLHSERSFLAAAPGDLGFTIQKQRADNELLVADGETAVIGGLTVTEVSISKSGIPFLVDLPLIGRLFGVTNSRETKRDLVILVTPHILDEGEVVRSREPNR